METNLSTPPKMIIGSAYNCNNTTGESEDLFIVFNQPVVAQEENCYTFFLFSAKHDLDANSSFEDSKIDLALYRNTGAEGKLYKQVVHIFSNVAKVDLPIRKLCFEAVSAFSSFKINSVEAYFTADESILFEIFHENLYFSLELFNDGDIVFLKRTGRDEPKAYDISADELYSTIKSIYDSITY
jgi:hypothetical protein